METKKQNLVSILNEQIKLVGSIKNELTEHKDYERAALFRDLEKWTEQLLESLSEVKEEKFNYLRNQKNKEINFSKDCKKIISSAFDSVNSFIQTKDFVLSYIELPDESLLSVLKSIKIDVGKLKDELILSEVVDVKSTEFPFFSRRLIKALRASEREAVFLNRKEATAFIIILCILRDETDRTTRLLNSFGMNYHNMSYIYLEGI